MAKYIKMIEIEAITFDELVEYGKANGGNIVNGMPWSFTYKGKPVTHETDDQYLVGDVVFDRGDMLVTEEGGNVYAVKPGYLKAEGFVKTEPPFEPTCPKCGSKNVNMIVSSWACYNLDCNHEWQETLAEAKQRCTT